MLPLSRRVSAFFCLVFLFSGTPTNASDIMGFDAKPPPELVWIHGNAWTIYAEGPIDQAAPTRLLQQILPSVSPIQLKGRHAGLAVPLQILASFGLLDSG
jgi:hypothetical protein